MGGVVKSIGKAVGSVASSLTGGDILSAGVGLLGGVLGSNASKNAANTQAASADYAAQLQKQMFDKQIELQKPFREAGLTAQNKLLDYMGLSPNAGGKYARDFSMADFQQDPGYAFRIAEGMKALDRTAASRGGLLSGATLRGATRYGQDMASQEYTNAFNRYQTNRSNQLNPLQSLMGSGQTAANQVGAAGQNYANQAGDAYMNAGNARASGYVGSANAWSNALGGIANTYNQNQMLNRLLPQGGNTAGGGGTPYYSSVSGGMVI
jgi:hypothetical protein